MSYSDWNSRLLEHFFNPGKRHRLVRLHAEDDDLACLGGARSDLARESVEEAARQGCETVQDLALLLHDRWESEMDDNGGTPPEPPPFLAILILYVIAVDHGDDQFFAHAYYDRLHDLLGNPPHRIDSIEPSMKLWQALEQWSSRRLAGRMGFFEASARGQQAYVGIPRRQALLAAREEEPLRLAFRSGGLRPGSDPSDNRLVHAVKDADGLLTRTKALLRSWPRNEESRELLAEIRARFQDWDACELGNEVAGAAPRLGIRLVLRAKFGTLKDGRFEADVARGITDRECQLTLEPSGSRAAPKPLWLQSGDDSGRPLLVDEEGDPQWHSPADWFTELTVGIDGSRFVLARPARPFLLFRYSSEGLLEECEEADLRVGSTCLAVAPADRPPALPSRLHPQQTGWKVASELPGIVHRAVRLSTGDRNEGSPGVVARLAGGIRSAAGERSWLSFATPRIVVGGLGATQVCEVHLRRLDRSGRELGRSSLTVRRLITAGRDGLGLAEDAAEAIARFPSLPMGTEVCEMDVVVEAAVVTQLRCFIEWSPESLETPSPMARDTLGEPASDDGAEAMRGLRVPDGRTLDSFDVTQRLGKPIRFMEPSEDVAESLVMRLLRARGSVSWQQAKAWLPACLDGETRSGGESIYLVDQVVALHALGLLELEEDPQGGFDRLVALPPAFTLLPRLANRGLSKMGVVRFCHEALLTGCWLPDELERLRRLAGRSGAELLELPREEGTPLVPRRRSLLVEGDYVIDRLRRIAHEARVEFVGPEPVACTLARTLANVDVLRDDDRWVPGLPAAAYTKRFFDPRDLGVLHEEQGIRDRYVLWECRDRHRWHHFIVDRVANKNLRVHDRQLGRWFVRRQALPSIPVPVSDGELFVPLELRLPRVLERVLALSAGRPLRLKRWKRIASPFTNPATARDFAIPAPPERTVDWSARLTHCSGNFCCYPDAFGTEAWKRGEPIPMLGCAATQVMGLGLEK